MYKHKLKSKREKESKMLHLKKHHVSASKSWLHELDDLLPKKRIVKKSGLTETYLRSKLAKSVHGACMGATGYIGEAETTALLVCREVENWLENKYEVTSADIKRKAAQSLARYNPRAAYELVPIKEYQVKEDHYGLVRL